MGENFRIFHKIFFTFLTKFDNDYFQIIKTVPEVWGGGAPQNFFATLQTKILLTSQKNANQQGGGQNECKNLARYNCKLLHKDSSIQVELKSYQDMILIFHEANKLHSSNLRSDTKKEIRESQLNPFVKKLNGTALS